MVDFTPAERVSALPPNFFGALDRLVAALPADDRRIIDVSKGNPDLPTPAHIVRAMQDLVADPANHSYPSFTGRRSVREAIAKRYREDHGIAVDPVTQVAVFHGSHEGLMAGILGLADPETTVVLPDPGYPVYRSAVEFAGARSALLPLIEEHDYQPDFGALADSVHSASVLLLNYPNNPTGSLATAATFAEAGAFARRTGAAFIHDFAYSSLGFDGRRPLSALSADPDLEITAEVSTLSKTYNMAGWRFGFAVGNASIIDAMQRYQSHAFSTIFGATQEAAAVALSGDQSEAEALVRVYERRRDIVVAGLRAIGWQVTAPQGSFFVWLKTPGDGDDLALAARLRDEQRVAVAPGSGFGARGRGHIRLSLVHDEEVLAELVERFAAFDREQGALRVPA